jgi:hypothetical protein
MNKLNGWVRIGIVLSILWVLGGGIYANRLVTQTAINSSNLIYSLCTSSPPSDAAQSGFYKYCGMQRDDIYKDATQYRVRDVALFALLPVPIFWLIAYIIVLTFRWIKKGFISKNE